MSRLDELYASTKKYGFFNDNDRIKSLIDDLKEALTDEDNDGDLLIKAYDTLSEIVRTKPDLAGEVFEAFKIGLANEKNNAVSLLRAYSKLSYIVKAKPELAGEVLEAFKTGLANEKNDSGTLYRAYYRLSKIVETKPELAGEVLEAVKIGMANEKNSAVSLDYAYYTLSLIVKAKPELAGEVLEAVKTGLANENNGDLLREAYEENNGDLLREAYGTLSRIIKTNPEMMDKVWDCIKDTLANIEENEISTHLSAMKPCLQVMAQQANIQNRQDISKDIVNNVLLKYDDFPDGYVAISAACMKKLKVSDFENLDENNTKKLEMAKKLRFLTEKEIKYLCDLDVKKQYEWLEKEFSTQNRCMDALMAKLGEEQGIPKEETKNYRQDIENRTFEDNADWLVPASFDGAEVFGSWFMNYIKQASQHLSVHSCVYWLPKDMGKQKNGSFVTFVRNNLVYDDNRGQKHVRDLTEMEIIAKNWKFLKPEEEKLGFKEILAICTSRKYADQEYEKFAVEASKWGVGEATYKDYEDIYKSGLKVPEPFDSTKEFKFGEYVGRFLPREDPRVGFFGQHTNCCQHYYGVGKDCAISSIKDPYSQLFVIEKNGMIVAGSWAWENKEGNYREVCFDNIETIGEFGKHPMINQIYGQVGRYLTEEANCRRVTIGKGNQYADLSKYKDTQSIPLPTHYDNAYTDANSQVLLAENKKAKPLDKTQESKRFVRDVCFLDYDAMDKISAKCFPDSDAQLQEAGEKLTGLVLVDEIKGVVGYCLYDKDERYISDMAVLPEYRTDKNASSRRLMAEMIKRVKEIGGEWKAELRDKTSLRYMKAMQERGIVDMQVGEVDHEMDDGSKVYSVTFKPKETQREKTNKLSIQPDKNRGIR